MSEVEKLAGEYANNNSGNCCANDFPGLRDAFMAGYKAGFEIGCMKVSLPIWASDQRVKRWIELILMVTMSLITAVGLRLKNKLITHGAIGGLNMRGSPTP
jgi:hypothetical protein